MNITFTPIQFFNINKSSKQKILGSNLAPLPFDTVSFGSMKKNQFSGIDLVVVEMFKAPIENFNDKNDLYAWANEKIGDITNKCYGGRQLETKMQRNYALNEWYTYVNKENGEYTPTMALLILSSITKDLRQDNDKLPPVLSKGALASCILEIDESTKDNPKYQFNFNKMYETKLREQYFEEDTVIGDYTGWVEIPSKKHDPENFEENVEKLKIFSHNSWCTKSFNAEPYLEKGDFHVYLENGRPKLGLRFDGDHIREVQGEKNNGKIPFIYFDEVRNHIKENKYKTLKYVKEELGQAEKVKKKVKQIKRNLEEPIKENDVKAIFDYFNIEIKEDENGMYTISEYKQPSEDFTFKDLGIDENKLFEKVVCIEGNADLRNSKIKNLGHLQRIGGYAYFDKSQITSLGNLESIGQSAYFEGSQIRDLGKLKTIGGYADFKRTKITSLGDLESIGGSGYFAYSKITDLGNLTKIALDADFKGTEIKTLDKLEYIGGSADFEESEIEDLGKLRTIGQNAKFCNSKITSLKNLTTIGENAYFNCSSVVDLGDLESIGGNADFEGSEIEDLGKLKTIGENADFKRTAIKSLGNLESIGGNADFKWSGIEDLGNLRTIAFNADFKETAIKSLGNLESIGGNVDFEETQIEDLGNLTTIGQDAKFCNSKITSLKNLTTIGKNAYFNHSNVVDLGDLESIGQSAYFEGSQITSLGNLESIGKNAYFNYSKVKDLGKLRSIKGTVFVKGSDLTKEQFEEIKLGAFNGFDGN